MSRLKRKSKIKGPGVVDRTDQAPLPLFLGEGELSRMRVDEGLQRTRPPDPQYWGSMCGSGRYLYTEGSGVTLGPQRAGTHEVPPGLGVRGPHPSRTSPIGATHASPHVVTLPDLLFVRGGAWPLRYRSPPYEELALSVANGRAGRSLGEGDAYLNVVERSLDRWTMSMVSYTVVRRPERSDRSGA